MGLSYDDAFEVALILRSRAESDEKRAAELGSFTKEKGYGPEAVEWAKGAAATMRKRAASFRVFARETLSAATGGSNEGRD